MSSRAYPSPRPSCVRPHSRLGNPLHNFHRTVYSRPLALLRSLQPGTTAADLETPGSFARAVVPSDDPSLSTSPSSSSASQPQGDYLVIRGRSTLSGHVHVGAAKNSCLVLMAAALLADEGAVTLRGVPRLRDIDAMTRVLQSVGCSVRRVTTEAGRDDLIIDPSQCDRSEPDPAQIRELRASFLVIAPLLVRFGQCRLALPGGCDIGPRPVDLHVEGLRALGATVTEDARGGAVAGRGALRGGTVRLTYPSVGATETLLLAAVKARGATRIENAAREPEVRDLAQLLRAMGARIRGEGTATIEVEGVERLVGTAFDPIPDRIEAGTFLLAAAATRSSISVGPVILEDMAPLTDLLRPMGFALDAHPSPAPAPSARVTLTIRPPRSPASAPIALTTGPFPQFPTDLQPMVVALLTQSTGVCTLEERVFENRLGYTGELRRLGADVQVLSDGRTCHVAGPAELRGCDVQGSDLRAGAALVIAALAAQGESRVFGLHHLDRGYDRLDEKLRALGACVQRWKQGIVD